MRKSVRLVFVLTALAMAGACSSGGGNCTDTPTGPSCVSGKVDVNNRPPGPGPSVLASVVYSVHEGDCAANPDSCGSAVPSVESGGIAGTERTYNVNAATRYTVKECAVHPSVPGRMIDMTVSVMSAFKNERFNEGNMPSPTCIATSFETGRGLGWERTGTLRFKEDNQDLLAGEGVDKTIPLGFRIPDPGR